MLCNKISFLWLVVQSGRGTRCNKFQATFCTIAQKKSFCSASAMQSLRSFLWTKPFKGCLWRLQLRGPLTCVVILSFLVCMCESQGCSTCDASFKSYYCVNTSACEHGIVKDRCDCCDICRPGPRQLCGSALYVYYGPCADGYECVIDSDVPAHQRDQTPGICEGKLLILRLCLG